MDVTAPVSVDIKYKVLRYEDQWSYRVKMDFNFDNDKECIKDFLLVENGVYTFESENEAKIQAKRIGQQFREYFIENIGDLIKKVCNDEQQ